MQIYAQILVILATRPCSPCSAPLCFPASLPFPRYHTSVLPPASPPFPLLPLLLPLLPLPLLLSRIFILFRFFVSSLRTPLLTRSMCQLLSIILSMMLLLFQRQPIFRFRRVTPPSRDVKRIRGEGKTGERL